MISHTGFHTQLANKSRFVFCIVLELFPEWLHGIGLYSVGQSVSGWFAKHLVILEE